MMEKGVPIVNLEQCTGCGLCAKVCASFVVKMKDGRPTVEDDGEFGCIACGQCTAVCAFDAIHVTGRGLKKDDVFPLADISARASVDALQGLLESRRSVRSYQDRPLDKKTIERMLIMASTAPMGFPPSDVGVVVINGKDRVQAFAEDLCDKFKMWLFLASPIGSLVLNLIMNKIEVAMMKDFVLPIAAEIVEKRKKGEDLLFYNAPCVLIFHYPMKDVIDPTIVCSFATLAAEALGLGSCIIGTVPPALQQDKKLKVKWGILEDRFASIAMIVGYADIQYHHGIRRRFSSVKYL